MTIILDKFRENVARLKDGPCLKYKSGKKWQVLSWAEVATMAVQYAARLSELGICKGDCVGIMAHTRYEWTIADLAILSLGAIVVPIYPTVTSEQARQIISETGIKVIFAEDEAQLKGFPVHVLTFDFKTPSPLVGEGRGEGGLPANGVVAGGEVEINEDDIATIIYTSGTTGVPKGVVLTHSNIMAEVTGLQRLFSLNHEDIMLSFLPLAHVLARAGQFFQIAIGCQAAYAESMEALPENFKEIRPQMTIVVPRFIEKIYEKVEEKVRRSALKRALFKWGIAIGEEYAKRVKRAEAVPFRLRVKHFFAGALVFSKLQRALGGKIKFIVSGGAPLIDELAKFFHSVGILIIEGYGLTETFAAVTVNRLDDFHLGTVGKPLHGVDVKLADDGEILLKGGMVFKEYFKNDEATKEAFTNDGWFKSGDIGEFTRDGFLRITDRKKDIIVTSGGKNIAPRMIEALLEESPFISHAVVFGDRKKFLSAVVSLNVEAVRCYAKEKGIEYKSEFDLVKQNGVLDLIQQIVDEKNKRLSQFETIKKFAILDRDFTVENGELTPTMKVRRKAVEDKYKEIIAGLYK